MFATPAQRYSARRAAPITSLPALILGAGELSEVEKATMIGRVSQRRATMPELSRYCSVYAHTGACALMSANSATMALSPFRSIKFSIREKPSVRNSSAKKPARTEGCAAHQILS